MRITVVEYYDLFDTLWSAVLLDFVYRVILNAYTQH